MPGIDLGPPTAAEIAASEAIAAGSVDAGIWPWPSTYGVSPPGENLPNQPMNTVPIVNPNNQSIWSQIGGFIAQITPSISSAIRGTPYGAYPYGGYSYNGQYYSPYGSAYGSPYGSPMSGNLLLYLGLGLLAFVLISKSARTAPAHAGAHSA